MWFLQTALPSAWHKSVKRFCMQQEHPDQCYTIWLQVEGHHYVCIKTTLVMYAPNDTAGSGSVAMCCCALSRERVNLSAWCEQEVVPGMEEVGLLRDALKQLDQPFLMVVVGEFNSGKSTVINALLGRRFLAEGILPTTNEISILKFRSVPWPQ